MKRPYEKPTLIDLSLPTARAGRVSGGASPQAICVSGTTAGKDPWGPCELGLGVGSAASCQSGTTPFNACGGGTTA
jgi:hypothetical protein